MDNTLLMALAGMVFLLLIFLALRELACWYWKINEIVALQKDILKALRSQATGTLDPETPRPSAVPAAAPVSPAVAPSSDEPKKQPRRAARALTTIPPRTANAYYAWLRESSDRNYRSFLEALSADKGTKLPRGTTAADLRLTFPALADRVDFDSILQG